MEQEHLVLVKVRTDFDFSPQEAKELVESIIRESSEKVVKFSVLLVERETSPAINE